MALRINFTKLPLSFSSSSCFNSNLSRLLRFQTKLLISTNTRSPKKVPLHQKFHLPVISAALPPLDLTEDNIRQVLLDARSEASASLCFWLSSATHSDTLGSCFCCISIFQFPQIFDTSVGMTGDLPDSWVVFDLFICQLILFFVNLKCDMTICIVRGGGTCRVGWSLCEGQHERQVLAQASYSSCADQQLSQDSDSCKCSLFFLFTCDYVHWRWIWQWLVVFLT